MLYRRKNSTIGTWSFTTTVSASGSPLAKRIRQQAYVFSYGERITGASSVSATIKEYFSPAALSGVGSESRLRSRVNELIREVTASDSCIANNIMALFHEKEVIDYGEMIK